MPSLGINQLGAVYEGLLSYSGFFAHETLYEVKPADKRRPPTRPPQTYFVPESDLKRYEPDEFVYVHARCRIRAAQGDNGVKVRKSYQGQLHLPPGRPRPGEVRLLLHARGADPVRGQVQPEGAAAGQDRRRDPRT